MVTQLIPSFNAGLWSPLVAQRSDHAKYRSGCRQLQNFNLLLYGGLRKRAGLEHVSGSKDFGRARVIPFQYSTSVGYMLELGEGYLRVWQRDKTAVTTLGTILPPPDPGDDPREFAVDFYRNESGTVYRCVEAHEETTFAADLAAGKWVEWDGPLEFATPYSADDLRGLQYRQINAVMRFVHPDHPPHVLRFESAEVSYFREIEWDYPALLDENLDDEVTITTDFTTGSGAAAWSGSSVTYQVGARVTYSGDTWKCNRKHVSAAGREPDVGTYKVLKQGVNGEIAYVELPLWTQAFADSSAVPGQAVDLTSTVGLFTAEHVGSYWEISKARAVGSYQVDLKALDTNHGKWSDVLVIQGGWQFSSFGIWDGSFYLERSMDRGASWEEIRRWESDKDRNVTASGEQLERCLMRLRWDNEGASTTTGRQRGVLEALSGYIRGVVRITAVTDANTAEAVCVTPVEKCTTEFWAEGAWSDYQGYPRAVATHEGRVIYGGTERRALDYWGSASDDYDNFRRGVADSDAWVQSLLGEQQNAIQWMLSAKEFLVGTSGGEWVVSPLKEDAALAAANVKSRRHSGHGSEHLAALLVNEAALFVQNGGRVLREQRFSFEADGYVTRDLSIFAEHITRGGVVELAYQQKRDSIVWGVTGDGELIGLTYERGEDVGGWHRHVTDGEFESVAVLATEGEENEIWVVVKRTVGGVAKRYIERFEPNQVRAQEADDRAAFFFVDAGVTAEAVSELAPIDSVSGLDHLVGKTVDVIADGNILTRRVLDSATFELGAEGDPESALKITVGLPYVALVEPLPLVIPMDNGTSAGRMMQIGEVDLFVEKSGYFQIGATVSGEFDRVTMREIGMPFGEPVPLYSGLKSAKLDARNTEDASFVIKQDAPLPLTLLAAVPKWETNGDR